MAGGEAGRREEGGGQGQVRKACGTSSQDQMRPGSQGPGEPYTSRGSRSSGVPVMAKERCLMFPPGGRTDLGRDTQMSRSGRFCRAMLIKLNSGGLAHPERRQWHPLQYSCLENPLDGGAW